MITVFDNPTTMCRELREDGEILFIVAAEVLGSGPSEWSAPWPPCNAEELLQFGKWDAGRTHCARPDWVWEEEDEE